MAETFTITSQAPDIELNDAGTGFINGWKITYKVTSGAAQGTTGTLFVSEDNHNAADVGSMIAAKLEQLDAIAKLTGG